MSPLIADPTRAAAGQGEPALSYVRHQADGPWQTYLTQVERADGSVQALDYIGSVTMQPGDVFVVETPGGGGWGQG